MSTVERYASQETSSPQQRAAQALEELEGRRIKQAQSLDQSQRKEARNKVKEYDFQSKLASNNYDVERQGEIKLMRTAQDYMDSSAYSSRTAGVQRIDDSVDYGDAAPYDTISRRPHFSMMGGDPVQDLKELLRSSMIEKIRDNVKERTKKASAERRLLDERAADHISELFDGDDAPLGGLSPSMLSTNSITRGGYEQETASNFGMLNQRQAMQRAAQVEQMRENHKSAVESLKRKEKEGGIHRLDTDDRTRKEWESMDYQRGTSIQQRFGQSASLGEINDIVF
jgi:hypothetical protein